MTPCIDCTAKGGATCATAACSCSCHSSYERLGSELGRLVAEKQLVYGDSFGRSGAVMRILYPNGVSLEQLDDVLTMARVIDKLFRIATARDALGESPWRDVGGYALLAQARVESKRGGGDGKPAAVPEPRPTPRPLPTSVPGPGLRMKP